MGGKIDESKPFVPIAIALMTISDSRTRETDTSGAILAERIAAMGHRLAARVIIKDEVPLIVAQLKSWIAEVLAATARTCLCFSRLTKPSGASWNKLSGSRWHGNQSLRTLGREC